MAGIRLRHPSLRGVIFTVIHYRPYTVPYACLACGEIHQRKTYHLSLDEQGEVVVSQVIYERLRELRGLPLRTVGEERRPKPITVSFGQSPGKVDVIRFEPNGL